MRLSIHFPNLRAGFTVIELIVVSTIIALLSALLLPALTQSKASVKRAGCLNNLRQMGAGALMYSDDDRNLVMAGVYDVGDGDLNWLYGFYLDSKKTFVCPATKNFIRDNQSPNPRTRRMGLVDLHRHAGTAGYVNGSSYDVYGFMNAGTGKSTTVRMGNTTTRLPFIRKTRDSIQRHLHSHDAFNLRGQSIGPSDIWLIVDNTVAENNDYPDPGDNHGSRGALTVFCDGHAEWIKREHYLYRYERSQDDGRTGVRMRPGLSSAHYY